MLLYVIVEVIIYKGIIMGKLNGVIVVIMLIGCLMECMLMLWEICLLCLFLSRCMSLVVNLMFLILCDILLVVFESILLCLEVMIVVSLGVCFLSS